MKKGESRESKDIGEQGLRLYSRRHRAVRARGSAAALHDHQEKSHVGRVRQRVLPLPLPRACTPYGRIIL